MVREEARPITKVMSTVFHNDILCKLCLIQSSYLGVDVLKGGPDGAQFSQYMLQQFYHVACLIRCHSVCHLISFFYCRGRPSICVPRLDTVSQSYHTTIILSSLSHLFATLWGSVAPAQRNGDSGRDPFCCRFPQNYLRQSEGGCHGHQRMD